MSSSVKIPVEFGNVDEAEIRGGAMLQLASTAAAAQHVLEAIDDRCQKESEKLKSLGERCVVAVKK